MQDNVRMSCIRGWRSTTDHGAETTKTPAGSGDVRVVVARLRGRRQEIERAIFARVRDAVLDPIGFADAEYVAGLRMTIAAAVEYGLTGLEQYREGPVVIPTQAIVQARRAARSSVSLDVVLRRYIVGHALLWDYVMEEASLVEAAGEGSGLRLMSRVQTSLLDELVAGVTRAHADELARAGRSREQRRLERVQALLAGGCGVASDGTGIEDAAQGSLDRGLDYELEGEHVGVIGRGAGAREALRELAARLDRRLLSVDRGEGTVWAWLGGRRDWRIADLERAIAELEGHVSFATGEPARGLAGWRLTHQQAQAALVVALRRPQRLTRYSDVALLATALKDEMLASALIERYVAPLEDLRNNGPVLRDTLRAYIAAEHNASSAAAALGVVRNTVENRLRTIEERLGGTLHPCRLEIEVALLLAELGEPVGPEIPMSG